MKCRKCGTETPDNVNFCANCGESLAPPITHPPLVSAPANHQPAENRHRSKSLTETLTLSICSLICCGCFPLGAVAVYYAVNAQVKAAQGDFVGADKAEESAKSWAYLSFIVGVTVAVISLIVHVSALMSRVNLYN
jgi:Interferon-induced transmembrane protein/zinc-ribbon domain